MKRSILSLPVAALIWLVGSSLGLSVSTAESLLPVQLGMSARSIERDEALVIAGQLRAAISTATKGHIQVTLRHRPIPKENLAVGAATPRATPSKAKQATRSVSKRVQAKRIKRRTARAKRLEPRASKKVDLSRQLLDDAAALAPAKVGAKKTSSPGKPKGSGHRLHAKPGTIKGKAGRGKAAPGTGTAHGAGNGRWSTPGGPGNEAAIQPKNRSRKKR